MVQLNSLAALSQAVQSVTALLQSVENSQMIFPAALIHQCNLFRQQVRMDVLGQEPKGGMKSTGESKLSSLIQVSMLSLSVCM
jgi:hypothetical protein